MRSTRCKTYTLLGVLDDLSDSRERVSMKDTVGVDGGWSTGVLCVGVCAGALRTSGRNFDMRCRGHSMARS